MEVSPPEELTKIKYCQNFPIFTKQPTNQMINFFRKTRKKMADDNRPLKYMRYAIGEIALVVIGILIALSINNWNERKKNQEKLMNIFIEIQNDLSKDILRLDEILIWYKKTDSLIYLVLNDSLTMEDYKDNPNISQITYFYESFDIHANGFNNLMNNLNYIESTHQPIVDKLKNLYTENKNNTDKFNEEIVDQILMNLKNLGETKKWASKRLYGLTSEMREYYLNDPFYINSVNYFNILLYNMDYLEYRNNASLIYSDLSELIGKKMEFPIHLINSIHNPDSLKKYIGTYKPLDSIHPYNYNIITDKHDIYISINGNKFELFQIARDTFGLSTKPNLFTIFKRDNNGEIVSFKVVDLSGSYENEKIE